MQGRIWWSALAISAGIGSVALADVTGKAVFDGEAPKPKQIKMDAVPGCAALHANPVFDESIVVGAKGELKNVVVYIKEGATLGGQVPKNAVMLDQKGCVYTPHVVTVMVGQTINAQNSDAFLHNVHGLGKDNGEFNFPQTQAGQVNPIPGNKAAETYKVKCDVHPWMSAWVVVLEHPFSAVTGDNGAFTIDTKGVKDGDYTLVAWQEKLGTQEIKFTLKNGQATIPDIKFVPKKKPAAAADPIKEIQQTVSIVKPKDEVCEHCEKDAKVAAKPAAGAQPQAAAK